MDWPLWDTRLLEQSPVDTTTAKGLLIPGAAANVKGAWTEVIASTTHHAAGMLVHIAQAGTAVNDALLDIAIGGAGTETTIVSNLMISNGGNTTTRATPLHIPLGIPAGTRLSARCQSVAGSGARLQIALLGGGWNTPAPLAVMTTYGAATSDSGAVSLVKGAWTEITAATTRRTKALIIAVGNRNNNARSIYSWLLDIGTGAAGAETVLVADQHLNATTSEDLMGPAFIGPLSVDLPAGTRLAARAMCDGSDATDRTFDLALYGLD